MAHYYYYGGPHDRQLVKPVVRLLAQVRHVQFTSKGTSISFDLTYSAPADCIIATLGIGFADGYPKNGSNGRELGGRLYPIAGKICMDMIMVDLGQPS